MCKEVARGGTGTFASVLTGWAAIQTLPLEPKGRVGAGKEAGPRALELAPPWLRWLGGTVERQSQFPHL